MLEIENQKLSSQNQFLNSKLAEMREELTALKQDEEVRGLSQINKVRDADKTQSNSSEGVVDQD